MRIGAGGWSINDTNYSEGLVTVPIQANKLLGKTGISLSLEEGLHLSIIETGVRGAVQIMFIGILILFLILVTHLHLWGP